jgi:hypothetical protein
MIEGGGRRLGTNGEQPILDDTIANPRISEYLTHAAAGYFGRENWGENGKALQEWTGIQGYTLDEQPIVGEAPSQKGLWICAGFHGHGEDTCSLEWSLLTIYRYGSHISICRSIGTAFNGQGKGG